MAKEKKLQNLLKFTEYEKLQGKQKATKKTDVGGFAVLEKIAVSKDDQIDEIKKALDSCSKKKIKKIYKMVAKCVEKKAEKEKESETDETGAAKAE